MNYINRIDIKELCNTYTMINLYGIYGIGKSELLKYIENNLEDRIVLHIKLSKVESDNIEFLVNSIVNLIKENRVEHNFFSYSEGNFFQSLLKKITNKFGVSNSYQDDHKLIQMINLIYKNHINDINNKVNESLISKLSRVMQEVLMRLDKKVTILIDDMDYVDSSIIQFVNSLLTKNILESIIYTSESKIILQDNELVDTIYDLCVKDINYEIKTLQINSFDLAQTRDYLRFWFGEEFDTNNALVVNSFEITSGVPLLLKLVLDAYDRKSIENLNFDESSLITKLEFIYKKIFSNLSTNAQQLIYILQVCGGAIDLNVAQQVLTCSIFECAFSELINSELLVQNNNLLILKYKLVADTIKNVYKDNLEKFYKRIVEAYGNSLDYTALESLYNLHLHYNNTEEAHACLMKLCENHMNNKNYNYCIPYIKNSIKAVSSAEKERLNNMLIQCYFYTKQYSLCIEHYKSEVIESDIALYYAAQSAYYLNDTDEVIKMCSSKSHFNNQKYEVKKNIIFSSACDLKGYFKEAIITFNKGYNDAMRNNDMYSLAHYDLAVQMISLSFDECIAKMKSALITFQNYNEKRYVAAVNNNIGIEYLMNGDEQSLNYLMNSRSLFEEEGYNEIQFPLNNLGLYYLLKEEYEMAIIFFHKASTYAISPLQKTYIYNNLMIANIKLNKDIDNYISLILKYVEKCPDPLVKSKVYYNLSKVIPQKSTYYQNKGMPKFVHPQYGDLIKRYQNNTDTVTINEVCDRRRAFINYEFYLGELMFYN